MLTVQSKLEAVTFKTKMECNYAQNPFTSQQLKPSTSEDILQHISVDKVPSDLEPDGGACSGRELPHGRGTLRTATGEFIYSGDWYKGKTQFVSCLTEFILFLEIVGKLLQMRSFQVD